MPARKPSQPLSIDNSRDTRAITDKPPDVSNSTKIYWEETKTSGQILRLRSSTLCVQREEPSENLPKQQRTVEIPVTAITIHEKISRPYVEETNFNLPIVGPEIQNFVHCKPIKQRKKRRL